VVAASGDRRQASRAFADVYADIGRLVASLDREKAEIGDEIARRRAMPKAANAIDQSSEPASSDAEAAGMDLTGRSYQFRPVETPLGSRITSGEPFVRLDIL
jgi:hypothetical protein